ncbi:TPA: hypothetical protein ACQZHW_003829 [Enterobacter hormaechei]
MSRFEDVQEQLNVLSPIPVNMPKLYLLGDTGAGKTTIVRKMLGTHKLKFPSVQQKRTTVAITEYVLSKDLPYQATYIFKPKSVIESSVSEILEIAIQNAYLDYKKGQSSKDSIVEYLEETPDERFRLKYILTIEQRKEVASTLIEFISHFHSTVDNITVELQGDEDSISIDEDIGVIIELAIDSNKEKIDAIRTDILQFIELKVSNILDGHELFSDKNFYQTKSDNLNDFIEKAKLLLSSARGSISPIVEHARLQGNLLATWLPSTTELVLIDGEGIGHDTREASRLSPRHLDYFHLADSIVLVEESRKPFASGGKSAIESVVRNGYTDKFQLLFTKLDEVEIDEDESEESPRIGKIRAVKKGLTNVRNALKDNGAELILSDDHIHYLSKMNAEDIDTASIQEINSIIDLIYNKFLEEKPDFVKPKYDYEMLYSFLNESSKNFTKKWDELLDSKHWQTVKAFNRRMTWECDGYRDMEPISDFHEEIIREMEYFISNPTSWVDDATPSMQKKSINNIKQQFSNKLLSFARIEILQSQNLKWENALQLSGIGSTYTRASQIKGIFGTVLPDYRKPAAALLKNAIKIILESAVSENDR